MTTPQLTLFAIAQPATTPEEARTQKHQQKKVARTIDATLAKMRTLHDELNQILYEGKKPMINSPADAAALLQYELAPITDHEELKVIICDRRNQVIQIIKIYSGSVNSSQIRVAEIFKPAIMHNASALILLHNHPSGDPTPSPDDVAVTRAIVQAGKLLDIECLDHIVIGRDRWISLKERGLGFS